MNDLLGHDLLMDSMTQPKRFEVMRSEGVRAQDCLGVGVN